MVDDVSEGVESAFKSLVRVMERSGKLRKDLKKDTRILEAVSNLRNYFAQEQTNLQAKTAAHKKLEKEVKDRKDEIKRFRSTVSSHTRHKVPSLDSTRRETNGVRQVLTSDGKDHKLYDSNLKFTQGQ
jgi:DNA repair ATPase RecN